MLRKLLEQAKSKYPANDPRHPNAVPRYYPSDESVTFHGRQWRRDHARTCPFCGCDFYSWSPVPRPEGWSTGHPDMVMTMPGGHRETCGHPDCILAAQDEHFKFCLEERDRLAERSKLRVSLTRAEQENDEKFSQLEGAKKGVVK